MATVAQFNQDQNQQQPGPNQGGSGQVINSTGGGGAAGVSSSTPGGAGAYSPPRTPLAGGPNIQQYLQANQGAGQQLSQGIQNNVQSQAQGLNQQLSSYQNQLSQQYNPLQQNLDSNAQTTTQSAFQNPQQLLDAYNASKTQSTNTPLTDSQQQAANQYQQFQQLATGGYGQNIQDYGNAGTQYGYNLQNQLSGIQQSAQNANTEMGRNQLLQNAVGQPNYNIGQQSLDSLFLQAQPGVANQLQQNLGNISQQAGQNVSGFQSDVQSKLNALQGLSSQDQQQIQNLFTNGNANNTGLNQITSNVQNEVQAALAAQPGVVQGFQQAAQAGPTYNTANGQQALGQFTSAQLQQLGLNPDLNAWGVNLGQYMSSTPLSGLSTAGQNTAIAGSDEFNRYNALNQLLGGATGTGTAQQSIFGTNTQQSATPYNPVTFDTTGFNNAVAQQQKALTGADFTSEINQQFMPAAISHFYGDQSSNIEGNIAAALKAGVNPNTLYNDLSNSKYQSALGNSLSSEVSANGLNSGFTGMGTQSYSNALSGLKNWLTNTYNPAAYDFLGDNATANAAQNPTATTPAIGGRHGPQIIQPNPTIPVDAGPDYQFAMPGTTPASWSPALGGI